jgi:hypothetical protein
MSEFAVLAAVAALVMLFVLAEIAAAVLPVIIVVALVPPEERATLAELIAAADSSRRLRLWPALRVAVAARRLDRARNQHRPENQWKQRDTDVSATPQSPAGEGQR